MSSTRYDLNRKVAKDVARNLHRLEWDQHSYAIGNKPRKYDGRPTCQTSFCFAGWFLPLITYTQFLPCEFLPCENDKEYTMLSFIESSYINDNRTKESTMAYPELAISYLLDIGYDKACDLTHMDNTQDDIIRILDECLG